MDNPMLVFVAIPFIIGAAIFAGFLLLTVIMPGEPKAAGKGAPQVAPVPARGPEYVALSAKRKAAYRLGVMVLFALFVMTFIEYWAAHLGSTVLMFIFILFKGAAIMYFFMHIAMLWRSEEAH